MLGRRPGDRSDEGGRDRGAAAVVDEDDPVVSLPAGCDGAGHRERLQPVQSGRDGVLAAGATGHDGHDLRRQPVRRPGRADGVRGDDEDDPLDLRRGGDRPE